MNSREITLWLDDRWYQALSQQLEVEKLEDKLNEYLDDLISLLPTPVYEKIIGEIREEERQREQELAANQKYTAFCVREDGAASFFQLDRTEDILEVSKFLRRYLREGQSQGTAALRTSAFARMEPVTAERYDQLLALRMEAPGKVTDVFDLDFDKQEVSTADAAEGWKTWSMQDVSTAIYHAYRKSCLRPEQYMSRFLERLEGKALTSPDHLSARDISFAEEISEINGLLNFYMTADFDVDKMFGTHVCTEENDDTLNVYANYDCASGQVCGELEVDLHRADGREEALSYTLNAAEKEVLLRRMDAYCQEQTGQTLAGYSTQLLAEEMAPPAAPSM